ARISDAKGKLQTPADYLERADWFGAQALGHTYEAYQQLLEQRNAVDFDDLLMRVAVVLRDQPDITERLNVRFRYVLIDEYQDTNRAQYMIAHSLSQHHRNICATGDPDQSIYAWRGADIRNILEFERDYPDAVVVRLEQNYRSTQHICQIASQLIANNRRRKHKDLWTTNGTGEAVRVWQFTDGAEEAERIAQTIADLHAEGRPWNDFAIFYRVNAVSRGFEESLRARAIPYKIARGVEFYNRKEIRDVLAYLRVLVNPTDDLALLRIINMPPRGIGKTTIDRLRTYANESGRPLLEMLRHADEVPALQKAAKRLGEFVALLEKLKSVLETPVSEAVSAALTLTGLEETLRAEHDEGGEDRLANVQELVSAALRYEQEVEDASLADFLNRVSLVSDQDAVDEQAGCVLLMTLHAAKGLEFPVVFLAGLEQGLLPHDRSLGMHGDVEEERRLCFVGITRARERLILSRACERLIRGQLMPRPASQFLREIDDGSLEWENFQATSNRWQTPGRIEGLVPLVEDLPPEEAARLVPKRRLRAQPDSEAEGFVPADDESPSRLPRKRERLQPAPSAGGPFADWQPGTLVRHERYGVGQVLWIRPAPGQTRAGLKFVGYGEKTLILELAPVSKLERKPR
ncbi:MAG: 3'-5' exonuclease, partial [Mycobacterium sp.]|nr:3'-5' exonuclease [Mycobacterium sp.]